MLQNEILDEYKISDIDSIIIYDNNRTEIDMNENDYELLYKYICESIPTRKDSVNEFPYIEPFYTVSIDTNEIITYEYGHIYENNGTVYLEIPYIGIYKMDNDVLKLLVK